MIPEHFYIMDRAQALEFEEVSNTSILKQDVVNGKVITYTSRLAFDPNSGLFQQFKENYERDRDDVRVFLPFDMAEPS